MIRYKTEEFLPSSCQLLRSIQEKGEERDEEVAKDYFLLVGKSSSVLRLILYDVAEEFMAFLMAET